MYHTPKTKWQWRLVNISFVILVLVAIGLLQWLGREYHLQFDLTQNRRHSLSEASLHALENLKDPLTVTAFASRRGNVRAAIRETVARYQKYKSDIRLEFVDPDTAPERVRAAGVHHDGTLLLEYGGAKETLPPTSLNEEGLTSALTRLGHRGERWLVFLGGHGERSPDTQRNFDLSTWASHLNKRGFKTRTLKLAENPQIPHNTSALVIAGPQTRLLPGEVKQIEKFIKDGGNLLWLADPGPLEGLEPLAEMLGLEFQPGVIVDPASQVLTGNPTNVVIANYGAHPIVRNFVDVTLFPHAVGIDHRAPKGWRGAVLIDTRPSAWSETGSLQGALEFDKGRGIRGPLDLAVALTRERNGSAPAEAKTQQRIVVIGDGDFLSNTYLGNGGNLDLGLSLANWLSRDDAYVSIPVRTAHDKGLQLSRTSQIVIAAGFLIFLPLALAGGGVTLWLRRRKR